MSERKDDEGKKPADSPDPSPAGPGDDKTAGVKSSGRVAFDSRGNPVWEWQLETGVYSRDVSTQRLKKLDLGHLSLMDTGAHKKADPKQPDPKQPEQKKAAAPQPRKDLPGGGFNPYDSGSPSASGGNPYDSGRPVAKPAADPKAPPRTPTDLRKLDEWIKLKKSLDEKKKQDED